jgi:hypothetical protein
MMAQPLSTEVIIATVYGILQLLIGFVSLWQQRHVGRMSGMIASFMVSTQLT